MTSALERLAVRVDRLEPTRFHRAQWGRVIALSVAADAVQGWDPGDSSHPGPEATLLDEREQPIPVERSAVDDRASGGFRRVLTLEGRAPFPAGARLRLSFLLDEGSS